MDKDLKALLKLLAFLVIAIGLAGTVSYFIFGDFGVEDIRAYVNEYGNVSPMIFVVVTIFFVIFPPAPNDLMAIAGGLLFGFWTGLGLTLLAFAVGSMIAWAVGRKLGRPFLKKIAPRQMKEYTMIFQKYGAFGVLVARMIPVISFDLVSYFAGIFKLNPLKFAAATFIGMVPNTVLLVKIGEVFFTNPTSLIFYVGVMIGISGLGIYTFHKFKNHPRFVF